MDSKKLESVLVAEFTNAIEVWLDDNDQVTLIKWSGVRRFSERSRSTSADLSYSPRHTAL
jgi:hypothetical protein